MKLLKFKTNIKTEEQKAQVTPLLDQLEGLSKWDIDPDSAENVLSVSGENLNPQKIENAVQEAGFEAVILRVIGIGGEGL